MDGLKLKIVGLALTAAVATLSVTVAATGALSGAGTALATPTTLAL